MSQKAMKKKLNISLPLLILGLLINVSSSWAQVTATARVTLTVIPAPGISFTSAAATSPATTKNPTAINQANDGGLTIHASSNVAVVLTSPDNNKPTSSNQFSQGTTKTITSKDLRDVSKVEVVYLGS